MLPSDVRYCEPMEGCEREAIVALMSTCSMPRVDSGFQVSIRQYRPRVRKNSLLACVRKFAVLLRGVLIEFWFRGGERDVPFSCLQLDRYANCFADCVAGC